MNVSTLLEAQASRRGNKTALISSSGLITYAELQERVLRLGGALTALGVTKGDRVAVVLRNSPRYLEVFYALARIGAILVPINWRLAAGEIAYVLADSTPSAAISDAEFLPALNEAGWGAIPLRIVALGAAGDEVAYEAIIQRFEPAPRRDDVDLDDVLVLMYTSGTTGYPKGAMLTHENILWTSLNQILEFEIVESDVTLTVAPMFHVGGLFIFTLPAVHTGSTIVIHDHFDAEQVLKSFAADGITTMFGAPTMYEMLVRSAVGTQPKADRLRYVVAGGAPLPRATAEAFNRLFPQIRLTEGYGMTEASSCTSVLPPAEAESRHGSIGLPFVHCEWRIADSRGVDVAVGTRGELLLAGPTTMRGYWNRPTETEAAFWGRWLRTGDVAQMDKDGYVYLVDRVKDMIISGGENVYPKEVERVLEAHPAIAEAAVFGLPDDLWGETVGAVVVLRENAMLTAGDVVDYCAAQMAGFKKPRRVWIRSELPRNASGKVLKYQLREALRAEAGLPLR